MPNTYKAEHDALHAELTGESPDMIAHRKAVEEARAKAEQAPEKAAQAEPEEKKPQAYGKVRGKK